MMAFDSPGRSQSAYSTLLTQPGWSGPLNTKPETLIQWMDVFLPWDVNGGSGDPLIATRSYPTIMKRVQPSDEADPVDGKARETRSMMSSSQWIQLFQKPSYF